MRKYDLQQVIKAIGESSHDTAIYVGCDSKFRNGTITFATVVVLHIDSCKGGIIFTERTYEKKKISIAERLMKEVDFAVQRAVELQPYVGDRKFEVHIDFNGDANYKSNSYLASASGYVTSMGLKFKIKPGAWAASCAADHLVQ